MSQTVLITGASRGIGAAAARRFAAGGYQVAVNYLQSQGAAEALCRELDNGSFPIQADVADPDQVRAMVDTVLQRFGHLDAPCVQRRHLPARDAAPGCHRPPVGTALSVDTSGVFYAARAVLPHMIHRHAGRIITVSSMWGQVGGAWRGGLLRRQGGGNRLFQGPGQGGSPLGDHRQLRGPRGHRHRHDGVRLPGDPGSAGRGDPYGAGWGSPPTWRRPSTSWPPPPPPSSPDRFWPPTAASSSDRCRRGQAGRKKPCSKGMALFPSFAVP